ncbi:amidohydrolase family protein [Gallaecimonas xiamenensis]|uniref:Amidohydrolase n=1 Tax=Gallaecimonas xiamenensis 3-C-1 TaxID=745411 RepID=K2JVL5_9GAMM|nr:amidohydrolase family protein [Gallaecimonas xiamenensis]EKE69225.1 amidohydrolase [Gallaecimonas xiamenensis 3-C-1]
MRSLIAALLLVAQPALANDMLPGKPQSAPVLIKGATVHSVQNGALANTDLLFEKGLITAIGADLKAPVGTQVIDASGKHLYPGMIGLSTYLGLSEIEAVRSTNDVEEVGTFTPEVAAETAFNADSELLPTVRSNGVALVEVAPQGGLVAGRSAVMRLDGWNRRDMMAREDTGMHLYWPEVGDEQAREKLENYFADAEAYRQRRSDSEQQLLDANLEAMTGVMEKRIPLFIHADGGAAIHQILRFGDRFGLKWTLVGGRGAETYAKDLARRQVAVVVTSPQGLPSSDDAPYDEAFALAGILDKAGVEVAIALPSSWSSRDLPFAVGQAMAWGLDPQKALASVTQVPANLLGIGKQYGDLAVGRSATLLLTDHPLFDYGGVSVKALYIDGAAVDLDNRQKRLYRKYQQKGQ